MAEVTRLTARMALVKKALASANLKKSGKNSYSGFNYFTLDDFEPTLEALCSEHGICTWFNWEDGMAELHVESTDTDEQRIIRCNMVDSDVKGAQPIQKLGAIQTYMRRYLFMSTFGITEHDAFDENSGNPENDKPKDFHVDDIKKPKKKEQKAEPPKKEEPALTMMDVWIPFLEAFGFDKDKPKTCDENVAATEHAKMELKENFNTDDIREVSPTRYRAVLDYAIKMSAPVGPENFKDEDLPF